MGNSKVYHMDAHSESTETSLVAKMLTVFDAAALDKMVKPNDIVAIKVHCGEWNNTAYLRPVYARALADREDMSAEDIARRAMKVAADICIYTNENITLESLTDGRGKTLVPEKAASRDTSEAAEEEDDIDSDSGDLDDDLLEEEDDDGDVSLDDIADVSDDDED